MSENDTQWLGFRPENADTQILRGWHESLGQSRGDRAELRRCRAVDEVQLVPAYHRLRLSLLEAGYRRFDENWLALVAVLVASVRDDEPAEGGIAEQMARAKEGAGPAVSVARFRRLLVCEQPNQVLSPLRRILHLLGRRADVADLAHTLVSWKRRPHHRTGRLRLAHDYYTRVMDAD